MATGSAPGTRDPKVAATPGQDDLPAEIKALPEGSPARAWALKGYNDAANLRRELEQAGEREKLLQQDLTFRGDLATRLADRPGTVREEHTEPAGGRKPRELPTLDFDPFDPNAKQKIEEYTKNMVRIAGQDFADWYLEDRKQVWDGLIEHQSRLAGMNVGYVALAQEDPTLKVADYQRIFEAAPQHGWDVQKTYQALYADRLTEKQRAAMRQEIEAEVRSKLPTAPEVPAPPVLGGGGPMPRRRSEVPRPRTFGEATRQAAESSAGKLTSR